MRKALRAARSDKNRVVRELIEDATPGLKEIVEKEGLEWSQVEHEFIAHMKKKAVELIQSGWGRGDKTIWQDTRPKFNEGRNYVLY